MSDLFGATVSGSQFGFCTGRGITTGIFTVSQIIEKAKECGEALHLQYFRF